MYIYIAYCLLQTVGLIQMPSGMASTRLPASLLSQLMEVPALAEVLLHPGLEPGAVYETWSRDVVVFTRVFF